MTDIEMIELGGWLFAAWASVFCLGLLVHFFRRLSDLI